MKKAALLRQEERSILETELSNWALLSNRDAIVRSYQFKDFKSAFAFMTQCAMHAEEMNHHPEWLNVWNRVEVTLSTHDSGGLTQRDIELARAMDHCAAHYLDKK
ncbi:COG2154 Pterin-4a-carbinolamine dehydratase [Burkholderiaceae bacterium]